MWPRISALIATPGVLSPDQAELLQRAAGTVVARTRDLARADARAVEQICSAGGRFAEAAPGDVAAIRFAARQVRQTIAAAEAPPAQSSAILDLKHGTAPEPPPSVPDGCRA